MHESPKDPAIEFQTSSCTLHIDKHRMKRWYSMDQWRKKEKKRKPDSEIISFTLRQCGRRTVTIGRKQTRHESGYEQKNYSLIPRFAKTTEGKKKTKSPSITLLSLTLPQRYLRLPFSVPSDTFICFFAVPIVVLLTLVANLSEVKDSFK